MNPRWILIGFQLFLIAAIFAACQIRSRRRLTTNVRSLANEEGSLRQCVRTVQFRSCRGRSSVIDRVVDEMQGRGWHYLGPASVGFLESLRSWGGAVRLHFARTDQCQSLVE